MNDRPIRTPLHLTSYQETFIVKYTTEMKPGSLHILIAPTGTGKTTAISVTIAELIRAGRVQHALIIAPAPLTQALREYLFNFRQEAIIIDSRALRMLHDRFGSRPETLPPGLYILGANLAQHPDVQAVLLGGPWDLIVVEEYRSYLDCWLDSLDRLHARADAPAILLASHFQDPRLARFARATFINWQPSITEFLSQMRNEPPPLVRKTRPYRRFPDEVAVIKEAIQLARGLGPLKGMTLLGSASSSISSLEETLVRWVENPDEAPEDRDKLESLLQRVEQLQRDARLECFQALLDELITAEVPQILVLCNERATLEYLAGAIDCLQAPIYLLQANMPSDQRIEAVARFQSDGGVMITTAVGAEGLHLHLVDAAIHYDLPLTPDAFARREGRYRRYGRDTPCTVYLLPDDSHAHPLEDYVLRMVERTDPLTGISEVDVDQLFDYIVNGTLEA